MGQKPNSLSIFSTKLSVIHLISNPRKTSVVSSGVYISLSFEMIDSKCSYSPDQRLGLDLIRKSALT